MTCPKCDSGETRVLRTIPGAIVSREHACRNCPARWWSDQLLRAGTVRDSGMLPVAHRYRSALPSSPDLILISGSDPNPKAPENPKRARPRDADLGPVVFVFPVVGNPDEPTWGIRATQDAELRAAGSVGPSERSALRAQAHAVDLAEAAGDPRDISVASEVYLALRRAAGLTGAAGEREQDEFAALVASLSAPGVPDAAH